MVKRKSSKKGKITREGDVGVTKSLLGGMLGVRTASS